MPSQSSEWPLAWALAFACGLSTSAYTRSAEAQEVDRAAESEIRRAITDYYLKMEFSGAEKLLLDVVRDCEGKCQSVTIAKAWMYVGVVRGSGREEQGPARQAFEAAIATDAGVVLDDTLATPETRASYEAARETRSRVGKQTLPPLGGTTGTVSVAAPPAPERSSGVTGLTCTPQIREVQTRRPIPIECQADAAVAAISMRYQIEGESSWKALELQPVGEVFRGQIPCEASMSAGAINFFIVATDDAGNPVETLASQSAPERVVVDAESESAPAFEGQPAPARCEERVSKVPKLAAPDYPTNWIGVHFAADIGFVQGANVCSTANEDFQCFAAGGETAYPAALPAALDGEPGELGDPYPGSGIGSGASGGTLRALLSFEHAFSQRISAAARLGYAFRGGPTGIGGRSFLPLHVEGRAQYWLRGLRAAGLQPYLHVGAGLAQVDIKKTGITVRDCSQLPERQAFLDCVNAENAYDSANVPELPTQSLDSYRKLGKGFATAGGGVTVPLVRNAKLQVNLNAMLMLPSVGLVLQPSIGIVYEL